MRRSSKTSIGASPELVNEFSLDSRQESRKPRHKEVLESILGGIASGRLRAGDRLPTEAELSKTFDASRATIARAMRELKNRGMLHRSRGGGTRVATPVSDRSDSNHMGGHTDAHTDFGRLKPRSTGSKRMAMFAPFVTAGPNLGYTGGHIYTHLSSLASRRGDDLCLQFINQNSTGNGSDHLDQMLAAVDEMIARGVRGVFYYPQEFPQEQAHYNQVVVEKMRSAGLAVVLVDRDIVTFPRRSNLDLISYDNRRGGYLVTDHLIRRGCKRIAFVGIPFASSAVVDRQRGYVDALEDHGIHFDRSMVRRADIQDLTVDFCKSMMRECEPDAIICKMDHYAAFVGRHLVEMGLKIGRDVLLAGFDDQPIAELLPVPLTTIRFPFEPFANVCYERLMKQMADPSVADAGLTLISVELVLRASTGDVSAKQVNASHKELAISPEKIRQIA